MRRGARTRSTPGRSRRDRAHRAEPDRLNHDRMKLCMFHPVDQPLERGWVGRVDGDRVLHLAAQTLQSLFLGGGQAREHAEYPLDAVRLLPPVQYPPAVRLFEGDGSFAFANPAAVVGPDAEVVATGSAGDALARRRRDRSRGQDRRLHAAARDPGAVAATAEGSRLRARARTGRRDRRRVRRAGGRARRVRLGGGARTRGRQHAAPTR